jgi:hypothetical protein
MARKSEEDSPLGDVTVKSPKVTLAGAIYRGARETFNSKPFGDPKDAQTTIAKIGRAAGNTAMKALTLPMEAASNLLGAGITQFVGGENVQSDRREGSIYKSSPDEAAAKKAEFAARQAAQSDAGNRTSGFEYKLGHD